MNPGYASFPASSAPDFTAQNRKGGCRDRRYRENPVFVDYDRAVWYFILLVRKRTFDRGGSEKDHEHIENNSFIDLLTNKKVKGGNINLNPLTAVILKKVKTNEK